MTLQQMKYASAIADCKSMNKAAQSLFVSQPSLSGSIRDLEEELGVEIFLRTNRGIVITPEGEEFLGYARQVAEQYSLLENRYLNQNSRKKFSVSTQHYTFAIQAFVETVRKAGMEKYEFAIHETMTWEIMESVKNFKSEIGVVFLDQFNEAVMKKYFKENGLEFVPLFSCSIFVFLWNGHPLAGKPELIMAELDEYPCLMFDQGDNNSFFFSEEVYSTYEYKRMIRVSDRATMLNLMVGLNGYTLCSGILCEGLNGNDYTVVPLKEKDVMNIGYIKRKGPFASKLAEIYIQELEKCSVYVIPRENGIE